MTSAHQARNHLQNQAQRLKTMTMTNHRKKLHQVLVVALIASISAASSPENQRDSVDAPPCMEPRQVIDCNDEKPFRFRFDFWRHSTSERETKRRREEMLKEILYPLRSTRTPSSRPPSPRRRTPNRDNRRSGGPAAASAPARSRSPNPVRDMDYDFHSESNADIPDESFVMDINYNTVDAERHCTVQSDDGKTASTCTSASTNSYNSNFERKWDVACRSKHRRNTDSHISQLEQAIQRDSKRLEEIQKRIEKL